jgi:SAM-dependent methyltransferase
MDWSDGGYEHLSHELLPAVKIVVDAANPMPGEHVVDLGCGDGNATLLVASRGARATGIDPASRLLEVGSARAAERSLDASFLAGVADAIPLALGSTDAVVSVFGVVFAPDAAAAAEELARVAARKSRVVLTAWRPHGALAEAVRLRTSAIGRARGPAPGGSAPFAWHDVSALRELFGPYGFTVSATDATLPFVGASAAAYGSNMFRHHPVWLEAARLLDAEALETLHADAIRVFADANEDPTGFRVTSEYVIATLERA